MRTSARLIAFSTAIALSSQAMAEDAKCLSRAELRTGIAYVMPALMKGVVTKCAPVVSSEGYLAGNGDVLISRYANESKGSEEDVRILFNKFAPQAGLPGADGQSMAALVESLVTVGVQSAIKPEICNDLSEAMALLDPLPASNMNGLIEFVLVKVDEGNRRKAMLARVGEENRKKKKKDEKQPSKPFLCDPAATTDVTPK
jgi:hypothetical protein